MDEKSKLSPFLINETTGEIVLKEVLNSISKRNKYVLKVIAANIGSPYKFAEIAITITVTTLSQTRNINIEENDHSVEICWSPPRHGLFSGYLISYKAMDDRNALLDVLNVTVSSNIAVLLDGKELKDSTLINKKSLKECTNLTGLKQNTDYIITIFAWNSQETGLKTQISFKTRNKGN